MRDVSDSYCLVNGITIVISFFILLCGYHSIEGKSFLADVNKSCADSFRAAIAKMEQATTIQDNTAGFMIKGSIYLSFKPTSESQEQTANYEFTGITEQNASQLVTPQFTLLKDSINTCVIVPTEKTIFASKVLTHYKQFNMILSFGMTTDSLLQHSIIKCTPQQQGNILYELKIRPDAGGVLTDVKSFGFLFKQEKYFPLEFEMKYFNGRFPVTMKIIYTSVERKKYSAQTNLKTVRSTLLDTQGKLRKEYQGYKLIGKVQ